MLCLFEAGCDLNIVTSACEGQAESQRISRSASDTARGKARPEGGCSRRMSGFHRVAGRKAFVRKLAGVAHAFIPLQTLKELLEDGGGESDGEGQGKSGSERSWGIREYFFPSLPH